MEIETAKTNGKNIKSVLDAFSNLAADDEKRRIDSVIQLMKHLSEQNGNEDNQEIIYSLKRLIRGIGSSRDTARKGYFTAFVTFLHQFPDFPLEKIFEIIDKELEMGKFNSKGEEGEVCSGRVLSFGALIRSGIFMKTTKENQKLILTEMVKASNYKSYLPQVVQPFLLEIFTTGDKKLFQELFWPCLSSEVIKPWSEQTLDSLFLLLLMIKSFPVIMKKSEIKKHFGGAIISRNNLGEISTLLFNIKGLWSKHPVYEIVCQELTKSPDLAVEFWHNYVDTQLLAPKSSSSKISLAIEIFCNLVDTLKDNIPHLLTPRFISSLRQRLSKSKTNEIDIEAHHALECLTNTLKQDGITDTTRVQCLEKIATSSRGEFGFDSCTRTNVLHSIVTMLKADGLEMVGNLCRSVICGESYPNKNDDDESNDSLPTTWLNKDRNAALRLLASVATHPAARADFLLEQTTLFIDYSFFPPPGCTSLCPSAKDSLLRCVSMTSSTSPDTISTMKISLTNVIQHINNKITNGIKPHKVNKEVIDSWKKMMKVINELKQVISKHEKSSQEYNLANIMIILFMQLGLQLYLDSELAIDTLEELHICINKVGLIKTTKKKVNNNEDEPHWTEVVTDLFLSLLSQNSHMLRNIVNRVFQAICPMITETALLNLAQVIDCSSEKNPLIAKSEKNVDDSEGESEDDDEDAEMENGDNQSSSESIDDDEEEADEGDDDMDDQMEDTVVDRVRAAVRDALGDAGDITDTDSVDVDDITDEHGKKLDDALSKAFAEFRHKSSKQHLTKKQSKDMKELLYFRVRVVDLIDSYIRSEQNLYYICKLIPFLFHALEACLKDPNQKPLEMRLRNCLRKIINVKKFANIDNVDDELIAETINSLIEKGSRTATVFLDINQEVSIVSAFLVKCCQNIASIGNDEKIVEIYIDALNNFFHKRDCLLPPSFFSLVLKTSWLGNFKLWPAIISAAFENNSIRPFRKIQALNLLKDFTLNEKLFSSNKKEKVNFAEKLNKSGGKMLMNLATDKNMKARYIKEFFVLLCKVCQHCKTETNWDELKNALTLYSKTSKSDIKAVKQLQNILNVTQSDLDNAKIDDFDFVKPEILSNGVDKSPKAGKKRKSKQNQDNDEEEEEVQIKKPSKKHQEKQVSKRKAKELRMTLSSDGLDDKFDFSSVNLDQIRHD